MLEYDTCTFYSPLTGCRIWVKMVPFWSVFEDVSLTPLGAFRMVELAAAGLEGPKVARHKMGC